MSSPSSTFHIILNITTTDTTTTTSSFSSHPLPSTYPSIPHANAAVQREVKAWAPAHLRMKMHAFTEHGTWEFEFVGQDRTEEVFVEAEIVSVDEERREHAEEGEGRIGREDGGNEQVGRKGEKEDVYGRGRTVSLPIRSKSTASESGAADSMVEGGRVLRKMPHRKAKGEDIR